MENINELNMHILARWRQSYVRIVLQTWANLNEGSNKYNDCDEGEIKYNV